MYQVFLNYRDDIIIIGILVIEISILLFLGINIIKHSQSLANVYFSLVFFTVVGFSGLNIVTKILSIVIDTRNLLSGTFLVEIYMLLVSIITASMVIIFILFGTAFFIINFGERYYRDRKFSILAIFLILIVFSSIIASYFLFPTNGFQFIPEPESGYDFFKINLPLAIYLFTILSVFFIIDLILIIRIFPDAETGTQKRKVVYFILINAGYFLGVVNLLLINMQLEFYWNYIYITSVLFLFSIFLLYFTIRKGRYKSISK
ncbi:MAG: hypothetical protein JW776_16520 [Candidatus Lokiarchaeota archaeon]|nr:hypothetical protein [Candidatus Lokiarchaeota archaeon]